MNPDALPSFVRPPVNEVVLSVAFDRPPGLTVAHLGDFWQRELGHDYPHIEEQPPYDRPMEVLGPPAPPRMNVQFMEGVPSPRLWARNEDGTRLVQLQSDWFAFNWRDAPGTPKQYPRWPSIEAAFLAEFEKFSNFLSEHLFGAVEVRQCEVTYINRIRPNSVWSTHSDIGNVIRLISEAGGFLPPPETTNLVTAYRMRDEAGKEQGRLHVTVQPALQREDNLPIIVLTLIARGAPASSSAADVLALLRLGHVWIVRGFVAITTELVHQEWGLQA